MKLLKLWTKWREPQAFNAGYLPPRDGHKVYFAEYGNPQGMPVLITHGGPGGSCRPERAGLFDLRKYRVIMFDQRGCGRSLPLGELRHNTTDDLILDMARLVEYLQIKDKLILQGGSWASTLMLLFAERYPEKVDKLLLSQIFLADERTEKWLMEQSSLFYPDMAEILRRPVKKNQSVVSYYENLLASRSLSKQKTAVGIFGGWERVMGDLNPHLEPVAEVDDKNLAYNRIYAQYNAAAFGVEDNQIMKNIKKISHIPTLIVHNRLDMVCPLQGAYELAQKMKNARLVIVPEKGHVGKLLYKTIRREIRKFL